MFVPHYTYSGASWHIKPVVTWLHYYDNKSCYENFLHVCFCFWTISRLQCKLRCDSVEWLSYYWIGGRSALCWHNNLRGIFASYQLSSCLAHLAPFALDFHLSPSLFKPQLNSHQCRRTWNIPQSQSVIQADKTARRTKRKRINEDYWHRVSHLPIVVYRQNILLLFRPSTVSAVTSWYAAAKHWWNSSPQISLSKALLRAQVVLEEMQHIWCRGICDSVSVLWVFS